MSKETLTSTFTEPVSYTHLKLAKRNIIHKNKAANLKSKLAAHISKLA